MERAELVRVEVKSIRPEVYGSWPRFQSIGERRLLNSSLPVRQTRDGFVIPVVRLDLSGPVTLLDKPSRYYLDDEELATVDDAVGAHYEFSKSSEDGKWRRTRVFNRVVTATDKYLIASVGGDIEGPKPLGIYTGNSEALDVWAEPSEDAHPDDFWEVSGYDLNVVSRRRSDWEKIEFGIASFVTLEGLSDTVGRLNGRIEVYEPMELPGNLFSELREYTGALNFMGDQLKALGVTGYNGRARLIEAHDRLAIILSTSPDIEPQQALEQLKPSFPEVTTRH